MRRQRVCGSLPYTSFPSVGRTRRRVIVCDEVTWSANSAYRLKDINTHCLEEFRRHWTCLENGNQQLWQCRPEEWKLNKCVYDNLVSRAPTPSPSFLSSRSMRRGFVSSPSSRESNANFYQKLEKTIPDQPKNSTPVHLRRRQVLADYPLISSQGPFVPPKDDKEASS